MTKIKCMAFIIIANRTFSLRCTGRVLHVKTGDEKASFKLGRENIHTLAGRLKTHFGLSIEVGERAKLCSSSLLLPFSEIVIGNKEKLEVRAEITVDDTVPTRVIDVEEDNEDDLYVVPGTL